MKSKSQYASRNNQALAKNIVIIDGFSSSGKSLVAAFLSYLERGEQWQLEETYDYLATVNYLGDLSDESASALMKINADKNIYNLMIGRNVNFRKTDDTSPYQNGLEDLYLSRSENKDGDSVVDEIFEKDPILTISAHYIFGYSDVFFRAFADRLKLYVVVLRNPLFLIKAWHQGNWVNRIGRQDRELHLCCNYGDGEVPWFVREYADEYVGASDLEKAVLTVYHLYTRIFSMYENLPESRKKKTMMVVFEKFIVDPDYCIDRMCQILETKRNGNFHKIMKILSLPRDAGNEVPMSFNDFMEMYKGELSGECMKIVKQLDERYSSFTGELV